MRYHLSDSIDQLLELQNRTACQLLNLVNVLKRFFNQEAKSDKRVIGNLFLIKWYKNINLILILT